MHLGLISLQWLFTYYVNLEQQRKRQHTLVKRYTKEDPHKEREIGKYDFPLPSREYILQYLEEVDRPVTYRHLLDALDVTREDEKEGFRRRLKAMQRDGQLMTNRRGSFALVKKMSLIAGRVIGHRDGFGFLQPDKGGDDIFLPSREMRKVFPNDRILVRVTGENRRGRMEGLVVEVLEQNTQQIVGRYLEEKGIAFVDADDKAITQDIIIPPDAAAGATHGQYVVAEVTLQPSFRRQPMGSIVEILGDKLTPGMEVELAIRAHNIPFEWPEDTLQEANTFPNALPEKEIANRNDLRHLPFVTIDGEDAKDFDDAVYCEKDSKGGWTLHVAIADVTHYVKPNSPLDNEAVVRGTSVYFPSKVIPMLPEVLSNNLCSLKPHVDRFAMVCKMHISADGLLKDHAFSEAVIKSHARLTYTEVADVLEDKQRGNKKLVPHLLEFQNLFNQLIKQRKQRGAIEFETVETRIVFGKQGKIDYIKPVQRNVAHKMIEEAMLITNVATAQFLTKANIKTLYRIHEKPDEKKLEGLRDYLKAFGLRLAGGNHPHPKDYSKLLERVMKRDDWQIIQTVMLRSLKQAVYSPDNVGHFGLAFDMYCQFTSPIRRYPDVLVHRAIKHILDKKKPQRFAYDEEAMTALGESCSKTERRADEATREAVDWLKCEYMLDKVGESFDGIISGVTGFGVFVELKEIYVEGLLHITSLKNDYYQFDASLHRLTGRKSGKSYHLGGPIKVIVARVDLDQREIDFELSDA